MLAAAAIVTSALIDAATLLIVPVLFLVVVPFEKLFPRHRGQRVRRPLAMLDIRYAMTAPILNIATVVVAVAVGVISLAWLPGLALRPVVALIPTALTPFAGVVLFDLATYWVHRWSHEVPALWRFHAVHHSTEHLDWVSGFRSHPFDGAMLAPPFVLLLAAGFDPAFTGVLAILQIVTGIFLHANVGWRWRPLHRVVITPEFHHWHHANEVEAHSSNYSVFLPLWDIVFGTYYMPRNRRPMRYGVSEQVPATMLAQLRYPLHGVRSPWQCVRRPIRSVRAASGCTRRVVAGIRVSTMRPRRTRPRPGEPLSWARSAPTASDRMG